MSFKVTDVVTNRKPICRFRWVINTNWHHVSYRFEVIADYCLNFGHICVFKPAVVGLRATYTVHLKTHWRARNGLPIRVHWTFARCYGLGDPSKYWLEVGFLKGVVDFRSNFHVVWDAPENHFCTDRQENECVYNFVADSFYTKKLCSRLPSSEVQFYMENGRFAFVSSLRKL